MASAALARMAPMVITSPLAWDSQTPWFFPEDCEQFHKNQTKSFCDHDESSIIKITKILSLVQMASRILAASSIVALIKVNLFLN